jgi:adenylosuccinate lyase
MAIILLDEMLNSLTNVLAGLKIDTQRLSSNLEMTRGQVYSEFVLDALLRKGIPRIKAYRHIQRLGFSILQSGAHFRDAIKKDPYLTKRLSSKDLRYIFDASNHLGASTEIIDHVAEKVKKTRHKYSNLRSQGVP